MTRRQSKQANYRSAMLEDASLKELRALMLEHFGTDPGPRASRGFMLGNLSWAVQAACEDENPHVLRRQLKAGLDKASPSKRPHRPTYRAGTRLVREWHGKVYDVTIVEDGYAWNGRTYRSLSQIATEITGVRWSGPRFFGLTGGGQ